MTGSKGSESARPALDLVVEGAVVHSYPLDAGEHVIGRAKEADIRLVDKSVSGRHATVRVQESSDFPGFFDAMLIDAGSTNGTRVNGEVVQEHRLVDGDIVGVGFSELRFSDPRQSDPEATGFMVLDEL